MQPLCKRNSHVDTAVHPHYHRITDEISTFAPRGPRFVECHAMTCIKSTDHDAVEAAKQTGNFNVRPVLVQMFCRFSVLESTI
jgi:hypothetical protein